MGGPGWLPDIFAALMLTVAVYCTGRLTVARRWRRPTELDTDAAHIVMGVAMAGMLVSGLRTLPAAVWMGVFAAGAAWFGGRMLRVRRGAAASPWRCLHAAPHLVECAAMLYMFLVLPAARPASVQSVAGMSAPADSSGFSFLAPAMALYLLGSVVRWADRLTVRAPFGARHRAWPRAGHRAWSGAGHRAWSGAGHRAWSGAGHRAPAAAGHGAWSGAGHRAPAAVGHGASAGVCTSAAACYLAPRCAALCKIAMGITMCYMLIVML